MESYDRSLKSKDSVSQAGFTISPAHDAVEELSYGATVWSMSKKHPTPDIISSLASGNLRPVPKPDSSQAVLQEQASTSGEGLVALRPSSMLEAVIQATNVALRGKEEPKKGEVSDYPSALKTGAFLSASNPRLVPRGRYGLLPGAISREAPTPSAEDWRCSTKVEPSSRASIPMSALRQWENMTCLGLHTGSTLDCVLGGLVSLVKGSPQKALSSPE